MAQSTSSIMVGPEIVPPGRRWLSSTRSRISRASGCSETISSPEFFEKVVAAFREEGADSWYARPAESFLPDNWTCSCGGTAVRKENDILDVWFDSGCSHVAVLKPRPELTWPCDVYLEGHDQHRGWFHPSLLSSVAINGASLWSDGTTPYPLIRVVDGDGTQVSP